ncbi:DUF3300 domain-containing protein [Marinimicrobium alkaliphilum]|uniref:DUF3300 domain-containing protein n=1 Tax=Marinimicrobium alkaliphilum TaxID=2202654 RepID=UPI000DB9BE60|nr:DUF3300 domain-containing protein [Marinimicrobium alkaliphilum]
MNRFISPILWLLVALPLLWSTAASADDEAGFSQAQLDSMLAPVALYPDTLLSHILIAATYPLEVVQAQRWLENNPGLEGEAAVNAAEDRGWDPSVTALLAFPRILEQMSDDLEWTQQLGDAFLLDEERMVATIQTLRHRAHEAGNLSSNDYIQVQREREVIYIEPARERIVYVPYYDTRVVYGHWWWDAYPPVYWGYPAHYSHHSGIYWSSGYRVHSGFYFSSFYWPRHQVVVIHHRHHHPHRYYSGRSVASHRNAHHWRHNPQHRRGVVYSNPSLRDRYAHENRRQWDQQRRNERVHTGVSRQQQRASGGRPTGTTEAPARTERLRNRLSGQDSRTTTTRNRGSEERGATRQRGTTGEAQRNTRPERQTWMDRNRQRQEQPVQRQEQPAQRQQAPQRETQQQPQTRQRQWSTTPRQQAEPQRSGQQQQRQSWGNERQQRPSGATQLRSQPRNDNAGTQNRSTRQSPAGNQRSAPATRSSGDNERRSWRNRAD